MINVLIIIALCHAKNCRHSQNFLLINVSLSCIFFSCCCTLSISLSIYFLTKKEFHAFICKFVGFLLIVSCHCLMFSYTSVALLRFLSIIYPFNRKIMTIKYLKIYLFSTWGCAWLISSISLILPKEHIKFQSKAKVCFMNQQSPVLFLYFLTGFIIPIVSISLMNLITYLHVKRSRNMPSLSQYRRTRLNKRKRRNLRLLRQFSFFTIFFLLGWTPFIIIELFDRREQLSDIIYLYSLILPPVCVLIDSSAILSWNKPVQNQIRCWWAKIFRTTDAHPLEREKISIEGDSFSMHTVCVS